MAEATPDTHPQPRSIGCAGAGGPMPTAPARPPASSAPPAQPNRYKEEDPGDVCRSVTPKFTLQDGGRVAQLLLAGKLEGKGAERSKVCAGARPAEQLKRTRRTPPRPPALVAGAPSDVGGCLSSADLVGDIDTDKATTPEAAPIPAVQHDSGEYQDTFLTASRARTEGKCLDNKGGGSLSKDVTAPSLLASSSATSNSSDSFDQEVWRVSDAERPAKAVKSDRAALSAETHEARDDRKLSVTSKHSSTPCVPWADSEEAGCPPLRQSKTAPVLPSDRGSGETSLEFAVRTATNNESPQANAVFSDDLRLERGERPASHQALQAVLREELLQANYESLHRSDSGGSEEAAFTNGKGFPEWVDAGLVSKAASMLTHNSNVGGHVEENRDQREPQSASRPLRVTSAATTSSAHSEQIDSFLRSQAAQQLLLQQLQKNPTVWWSRSDVQELLLKGGRLSEYSRTEGVDSSSRHGKEPASSGSSVSAWVSHAAKSGNRDGVQCVSLKRPLTMESRDSLPGSLGNDRQLHRVAYRQEPQLMDSGHLDVHEEPGDETGVVDEDRRDAKRQRWESDGEEEEEEPFNDVGEETRARLVRAARKFPPFRGVYFDTRRGNLSWRCSWKVQGKKRSRSWSVMKFGMERARAKAIAERMKHAPQPYPQSPQSPVSPHPEMENTPSLLPSALPPTLLCATRGVHTAKARAGGFSASAALLAEASAQLNLGLKQRNRSPQGRCEQSLAHQMKEMDATAGDDMWNCSRPLGGTRSRPERAAKDEPLAAMLRRVVGMQGGRNCDFQGSLSKAAKLCSGDPARAGGLPDYADEDRCLVAGTGLPSASQGCGTHQRGSGKLRRPGGAEGAWRRPNSAMSVGRQEDRNQAACQLSSNCCCPSCCAPSASLAAEDFSDDALSCITEGKWGGALATANRLSANVVSPINLGDGAEAEQLGALTDAAKVTSLLAAPLMGSRAKEGDLVSFSGNSNVSDLCRALDKTFDVGADDSTLSALSALATTVGCGLLGDKRIEGLSRGNQGELSAGNGAEREGPLDMLGKANASSVLAPFRAESVAGASTTSSLDERRKLALGTGQEVSPLSASRLPARSPEALLHRVVSAATAVSGINELVRHALGASATDNGSRGAASDVDGLDAEELRHRQSPRSCDETSEGIGSPRRYTRAAGSGLNAGQKLVTEPRDHEDVSGLFSDIACETTRLLSLGDSKEETRAAKGEKEGCCLRSCVSECAHKTSHNGGETGESNGAEIRATQESRAAPALKPTPPSQIAPGSISKTEEFADAAPIHRALLVEILQDLKKSTLPLVSTLSCRSSQRTPACLILAASKANSDSKEDTDSMHKTIEDVAEFSKWCPEALDSRIEFARTSDEERLEPLMRLLRGCLSRLILPSSLSDAEQLSLLASVLTYHCVSMGGDSVKPEQVAPPPEADVAA
ncbi:hypothetical protein BESB_044690 [Besnoitia besnoiti]|uniref:Uncharacterized protein n=1 Tax=Besnoitia besnoiti TaxID=94643 RepID=A0A2A9MKW9_BESBE|nr:hypothetical protein BESB_044690 [Besnoitia besnoiti]PFH36277.1 hypothetical protein BESB_044690 [Besnoitia besnoiti]